ncbi:MAG TPA: Gfo/Idh/MocA family oxidoreductase [Candidatus Angelobacter sp.]|nr:Gfo/Idh/MocA family oxidoreductase [Candidatus Angelobacter sp.]
MTIEKNTRRDFLKWTGAGLAGTVLSNGASSYASVMGANDRVRVGIVGFSDRFRQALLPAFQAHEKAMNFEFVALSDIWKRRREEGVAHLEKATGKPIAAARNNEELYDRKDVDAVIVATADFQHAQHGLQAVTAGRDAYVEKPMANTMTDARALREAVHSTGKIVQIGTQRRSAANYQRAYEFIRSGQFGDIVSVEMTWNVNQPGRWRRPHLVETLREEDTDWKRFLINRPTEPFDPRKYVEFRLFWPYSSGIADQWMVHQIDTVHWFTGLPRPRSVVANGGIYHWHDGRKNWDTMTAVFDYGPIDDASKGFQVVYASRQTNSAGDVKEIYYSNGGALDLDKNVISSEGGLEERYAKEMGMKANLLGKRSLAGGGDGVDKSADAGVDEATSANMRNWMECVRTRKTPNASIEAGYSHSVALCMTIAAIQTGQRVTFDDAKQEVVVRSKA